MSNLQRRIERLERKAGSGEVYHIEVEPSADRDTRVEHGMEAGDIVIDLREGLPPTVMHVR